MRITGACFSIVGIILVSGCTDTYRSANTPPQQVISSPPYGGTLAGTSSTATAEADRSLENQIRQSLSNGNLSGLASRVNIAAANGAVTLSGTVPSAQDREALDDLVRNTTGVNKVYDQLQVATSAGQAAPTGRVEQDNRAYTAPPPPSFPQASANTQTQQTQTSTPGTVATGDIFNLHVQGLNDTDRNLAQQILQGLQSDTTLSSLLPTVNINVSGGRVILQGRVQNQEQKQTIGSVVQRAAGNNTVDNQLQVTGQSGQ